MTSLPLYFSNEVQDARATGKAIVALESTIISHGLPYPENKETAHSLEAIIRAEGAVPATIAIIEGRLTIGLSEDELHLLASGEVPVTKVSRRDIASVIAKGQTGATTVAATMIAAELAGISVFATGGIGGVHRGAQQSFDISADLPELGRTNVAVVSAGPKAILDLSLTMEYLETAGVPVIGFQTDELPAFWSRRSGIPLYDQVTTPDEMAEIMKVKWQAGLAGGLLIANPVPHRYEIPADEIATAIDTALAAAEAADVSGKDVTPFVLSQMRDLTDGKSLITNQALVSHNAKIAAQIAVAYEAQTKA